MARPKLPRYIVILNIIMVVLVLVICALSFSLIFSAMKPEESEPEPTVQTEETAQTTDETVEQVTTAATTTTRLSVSMTKRTTEPVETQPIDIDTSDTKPAQSDEPTEDTSDAPTEQSPENSTSFDKSFFKDDLFIGDSISTGLYLYGKLDGKNVAASVGNTPYKAYTSAIELYDGTSRTALEYAESMQPKRIFVMLGSNGMASSGDLSAMEDTYRTLLDKLAEACPASEVYCISVSPVTADSTAAASGGITNDTIKSFNTYVEKLCGEKKLRYFDLYSRLIDDTGNFRSDYAEMDGLHFLGKTYDVMLSFIQNELS